MALAAKVTVPDGNLKAQPAPSAEHGCDPPAEQRALSSFGRRGNCRWGRYCRPLRVGGKGGGSMRPTHFERSRRPCPARAASRRAKARAPSRAAATTQAASLPGAAEAGGAAPAHGLRSERLSVHIAIAAAGAEGTGLRLELRPVGEGGEALARPRVVELGAEALTAEWSEDIVFEGPGAEAVGASEERCGDAGEGEEVNPSKGCEEP
uniref:Uncharacterized protein n=1 Tax=Alexandrium monilatum TaxID=311494 RepID=A0A7S4Q933_9DINO|mmetsp:Transcript_48581/g.145063  ORF Transcript_48581/g.145063 Transcript_48581/m.145063 type:complete len:208 (+) Transcript_48581:60-683(+)